MVVKDKDARLWAWVMTSLKACEAPPSLIILLPVSWDNRAKSALTQD